MRVLLLTWEFPPHKVGGIAAHTFDLSKALIGQGHDVQVVTYGEGEKDFELEGVPVHSVGTSYADDTLSWSMMLNHFMEKRALELHRDEKFDLVHGHDWMSVPASASLKKMLDIPMVFTLHSTEAGRSGVHDSYTQAINDLEWYGTYEADQVITVSQSFKEEVISLFSPPREKVTAIPNGVDYFKFNGFTKKEKRECKERFAEDWERIVLFVGRMVHQKGIDRLIYAMPELLRHHPEAKFVFCGGGNKEHYKQMAHDLVGEKAYFPGYVDDTTLSLLYQVADATVIPSIYEPFGIVALESLAAGTPAVASSVGGLKDIVIHEWCGLHTYVDNTKSIENQTERLLGGPDWASWMGSNGKKRVIDYYNWNTIADWTGNVYDNSLN